MIFDLTLYQKSNDATMCTPNNSNHKYTANNDIKERLTTMDNKTIVIADPSPEFRIGLKSFLAKKGYRIVGDCQDGYEAVRIIEETKPDAVILDILLPRLDGIEVMNETKTRIPGYSPVFIVVTGIGNNKMLTEATQAGAGYCIIKPCEYSALLELFALIYVGNATKGYYCGISF